MGFGLSKSQSLEELTPPGSMGAGTEQTPRPSSGKEPSSGICEVTEEGQSLTMRSSHPGSDSRSHPRRVAQQPAPLRLSRRITHSDARCARCTSSEQRGFHLLRAGGRAGQGGPASHWGLAGPQLLELPGCWAVARPQSGDAQSQSGKRFPRP